jgi:hypothetical protein
MKTTDLFTISSKKLNESLHKAFGKKINFEAFDLDQLQDARNKLRTQLSQIRSESGFNENLESDAYHQAQWMLDAINAEIAERDEHIIESDVEEGAMKDLYQDVEDFLVGWQDAAVDHEEYQVQGELVDLQKQFASSGDIDELYNELRRRAAEDEFYKSLAIFFKKQFKHALGRSNEDIEEGQSDVDYELHLIANSDDEEELIDAMEGLKGAELQIALEDMMEELKNELAEKGMNDVMRDQDKMIEILMDKIIEEYGEDGEEYDYGDMDSSDADADALKSAGFDESIQTEGQYKDVDDKTGKKVVQWLEYHSDGVFDDDPHLGDALIRLANKWETGDMSFRELKDAVLGMFEQGEWQRADFIQKFAPNKVKITQPDMFDDVQTEGRVDEKAVSKAQQRAAGIALAAKRKGKTPPGKGAAAEMAKMSTKELEKYAGTKHKGLPAKKDESVTRGEDMTTLREGEVQQASAIVTAKTMVDRVGRWIEELSGMENETLLQLGDSIRDEMGQEQAKAFIEGVAPAIQSALETLKGTRDTLSSSVRSLASGEQPADMLGGEPAMGGEEEMGMAAPDEMNMPAEEPAGDEFGAAEPAAGGMEAPGREQRESIERQNRLLKVLAG